MLRATITHHRKKYFALGVLAACLLAAPAALRADAVPPPALPANWQQLSQTDFVALCETWIGVTAATAQADKTTLGNFAWTAYLNAPTAVALTPDQFVTLGTVAASSQDPQQQALLRAAVTNALPANANIQALSITSLERLTGPLDSALLLTADHSAAWLQTWVDGKTGGADLSLQDEDRAWKLLQSHKFPATFPATVSLTQNMWAKYLQAKEGWDPVADTDVMHFYSVLVSSLPKDQLLLLRQNVWRRLSANVPQMAPQLTLANLVTVRHDIAPVAAAHAGDFVPLVAGFLTSQSAQLTTQDFGYGIWLIYFFRNDPQVGGLCATTYQAVATATISKLSAATPVSDYQDDQSSHLAEVFETDIERQQLKNLLSTGALENRMRAAKLLTWSYAKKLDDWRKTVAANVKDPQLDPDAQAFWFLVMGVIDADTPTVRDTRRSRPDLDQALAIAQSEPMRLFVIEQFADYFKAMRRPGDGASLLASLTAQFSPTAADNLKSTQATLERLQISSDALAQAKADAAAKTSQIAQLKDYQASLGRAQIDRNQNAVTRLQAAIADLQAQMQQPGQ